MFVGRETELDRLERSARKGSFQMAVVYGRRRVGKTALISEFAKGRRALFFTALEQSDADNLRDLAGAVSEFFGSSVLFRSWKDALSFIADRAAEEPFVFVFDEFPYAAKRHPALPSELQVAIDHRMKQTGMFLILCGSNQGFMESDVLGQKSPLYGRRTLQMKLVPLGYLEAAEMLAGLSPQDAFRAYACFGGVPYYLEQYDRDATLAENLAVQFFDSAGFLYGEPQMLLRQELSEPAIYNSILRAIAGGATKQGDIAARVGIETASISRYLATLVDLGIIARAYPFGENPATSRRGLYRILEGSFAFWFRFVMPRTSTIEEGMGRLAAGAITDEVLNTYLGPRFELVCAEWLRMQALGSLLPLRATHVGSWWGTDPARREQTDIDVLAADDSGRLLIGECKYRADFNETQALDDLLAKRSLVRGREASWFYLFSRYPAHPSTRKRYAERDDVRFVTLDDLYGRR
ncbi:MAG: ATP-binding protein [Eggerthellaceae bacterium]|nr:ATP-binding protein [Eggerthellaceae bacterium]